MESCMSQALTDFLGDLKDAVIFVVAVLVVISPILILWWVFK